MSRERKSTPRRPDRRRSFLEIQSLEERRLLSLDLTMLGQAPVLEGSSSSMDLATFSISTSSSVTYSASINWGDGTTSSGSIEKSAGGLATVLGNHAYGGPGNDSITVAVSGNDGSSASVGGTLQVRDAAITAAGQPIVPTWGQAFSGVVATFSDVDPNLPAANFAATITWGNGSSSMGTVAEIGNNQFTVSGSTTYSGPGPYTLQVAIGDGLGESATAAEVVQGSSGGGWVSGGGSGPGGGQVGPGGASGSNPTDSVSATGLAFNPVPGQAFNGQVATLFDTMAITTANFTASINWGDGTTTTGTIASTPLASGGYAVSGSHAYSSAGAYPVSVRLTENNGNVATAGSTALVVPTVLTATGANLSETKGKTSEGLVATVTDADTTASQGNLSAMINWGDGSSSPGFVVADPVSGFDVLGSHRYSQTGTYPTSVTVEDTSGHSTTTGGTATVADAALTAHGTSLSGVEGSPLSGVIATVFEADSAALAGDLTATITWGDGQTSTGTVAAVASAPGEFSVAGGHTYAVAGSYATAVLVVDRGGSTATSAGTASIAAATLTPSSLTVAATAGAPFVGTVATFTDPDHYATASNFLASIAWGDGTTTGGVVTADPQVAGKFNLSGYHTYEQSGPDPIIVQVSEIGFSGVVVESTANVADPSPVVSSLSVSAVEGANFSGTVATFTDPNPYAVASGFAATITWGDGQSTVGSVFVDPQAAGRFDVASSHAYNQSGSYVTGITVFDQAGTQVSISGSAIVTAPPLLVSAVGLGLQAGTSWNGSVATFGADGLLPASDFTATIHWGDGTSSNGTISSPSSVPDQFGVAGTHAYSSVGSYAVTVTIGGPAGASATGSGTASVTNLAGTGLDVAPTTGSSFSGTIATFTDNQSGMSAGSFTATVTWGDGTTSTGTISADPNISGQFDVSGTKVYTEAGLYALGIQVAGPSSQVVSVQGQAGVVDPALSASGLSFAATSGASFTGEVATFADPNSYANVADLAAVITWGDGQIGSGTVTADPGVAGQFDVTGTHTYAVTGSFSDSIRVVDRGGSTATASGTATVADAPLSVSPVTISAQSGVSFAGMLGSINDGPSDAASSFTATVHWGDGTTTSGTITDASTPGGPLGVSGMHTYATVGTYTATVTVTRSDGATTSASDTAYVTDLAGSGASVDPIAGTAFSGVVATFRSVNSTASPATFASTISWGDGITTSGTVVADPGIPGLFDVYGTTTYQNRGAFPISVQVTDSIGSTVIASQANVLDAPLVVTALPISSQIGTNFSGIVATFTSDGYLPVGDFTASINWGDGTTTQGTVALAAVADQFTVNGSHTYAAIGGYPVTLTITGPDGEIAGSSSVASVSHMNLVGEPVSASAGTAYSGTVATFTDNQGGLSAGSFTATIAWGDGATTTGTVLADPGVVGQFDVSGSHAFAEPGSYAVSVTVVDPSGASATAPSPATVADATITPSGVPLSATSEYAFTGTVTRFTDGNPEAMAGDFTATITWGDGTTTTATVLPDPTIAGTFDVDGTHTYIHPGSFLSSVTIEDRGGRTATTSSTATVAHAPLSLSPVTINAQSSVAFSGTVASVRGGPLDVPGNFTATIAWGDGTTTSGMITGASTPGGPLGVTGSHAYTSVGTYAPVVTVTRSDGSSASASDTAYVSSLSGSASSVVAVEGYAFTTTIATFTDPNPSDNAGDFLAVVSWGDNDSSIGTITEGSGGLYSVRAGYTYGEAGAFPVSVEIQSLAGVRFSATATAAVSPPPLVVSALNLSPQAGTTYIAAVATFTADGTLPASDFTATVHWGDGTTSSGTISSPSMVADQFGVSGTHTYSAVGNYAVAVTIGGPGGGSATGNATASVTNLAGTSLGFSVPEGATLSANVARFTDSQPGLSAGSFTATVIWGDGATSTGTIAADPNASGQFDVSSSHIYTHAGYCTFSVQIADSSGHQLTLPGLATVSAAPLTITGQTLAPKVGMPFTHQVATFIDPNHYAVASNFTATIGWGDGVETVATVTADPYTTGQFDVTASHVYSAVGTDDVILQVADVSGAGASVSESATVTQAALAVTAIAVAATVGSQFDGSVASFVGGPPDDGTNYSATINWGDGTTTAGTITAPSSAGDPSIITGGHSYTTSGNYTVIVTVRDTANDSASANGTASASNLSANANTVKARADQAYSGVVATFTDDASGISASIFSATITWGDGHMSSGSIQPDGSTAGAFDVIGSNVYSLAGTYPIAVQIDQSGNAAASVSGSAKVADAPLTATATDFSPTVGIAYSATIATFADPNLNDAVGAFTATIDWGDGTTSAATITADSSSPGEFDVHGSHTYTSVADESVGIQIAEQGGGAASASTTATVADATITPFVQTVTPTQGAQYSGVVATFTDANPGYSASDFTATIDWGEGTTSTGTIAPNASGGFSVTGTYTYSGEGTFPVVVTVTDAASTSVTVNSAADVADAPMYAASPSSTPLPTAGADSDGVVASFTDANPNASAGEFTATIAWGDGSTSTGTVSANSAGGFDIDGDHTYTQSGPETITATVTDAGGETLTLTTPVTVADAAITASGRSITAAQGQAFSGIAATFADANPYATATSFTATISWGDGTTSTGTISTDPNTYGQFDISGGHAYSEPGSYPVVVTVGDAGGQSSTATSTAVVSSSNVAGTLALAGAAGAFNSAFSGSSDTNTSSFDTGIGSVTPLDALVNNSGTGSTQSASPNTATMTLDTTAGQPTTTGYSNTFVIHESGPGYTLDEVVSASFWRTVTGTSTAGTFSQSLTISVYDHYHQTNSAGGTQVYDETDTFTLHTTEAGSYATSGGVTTIHGVYDTLETESVSDWMLNVSSTGGGSLFLLESETGTALYSESGRFATNNTSSSVSGGSTLNIQQSDKYNSTTKSTQSAGGATIANSATLSSSSTVGYQESDVFVEDSLGTTAAGFYLYTETDSDNGSSTSTSNTATDHSTQTESASDHTSIMVFGAIAEVPNITLSTASLLMTEGDTDSVGVTASGTLSDGTSGTYSLSGTDSGTDNSMLVASVITLNGATTMTGMSTDSSSENGNETSSANGTYGSGGGSGYFSESLSADDSSGNMNMSQFIENGSDYTVNGTYSTKDRDIYSLNASGGGSYLNSGGQGSFTVSYNESGIDTASDSGSVTSTNTSLAISGTTNSTHTNNDTGTYTDKGYTSTANIDGSGSSSSSDNYTDNESDSTTATVTTISVYHLGNAGFSVSGIQTEFMNESIKYNYSDNGNSVSSDLDGYERADNYNGSENSDETDSANTTTNFFQDGAESNVYGTFNGNSTATTSSISSDIGSYSNDIVEASATQDGQPVPESSSSDDGTTTSYESLQGTQTQDVEGSFDNGSSSGTGQETESTSGTAGETVTGTTTTTSPGVTGNSWTKDDYTYDETDQSSGQGQSSGSFSPAGTSGTFTQSETDTSQVTETDDGSYSQFGGDGVLTTTSDSGTSSDSTVTNTVTNYDESGEYDPAGTSGSYTQTQDATATEIGNDQGSYVVNTNSPDVMSKTSTDNYSGTETDDNTTNSINNASYDESGTSGVTTTTETGDDQTTSSDLETFSESNYPADDTTNGNISATSTNSVTSTADSTETYTPNSSTTTFDSTEITKASTTQSNNAVTTGDGLTDTQTSTNTTTYTETDTASGSTTDGTTLLSTTSNANGTSISLQSENYSSTGSGFSDTSTWSESESVPWSASSSSDSQSGTDISSNFFSGNASSSTSDSFVYTEADQDKTSFTNSSGSGNSTSNYSDNETYDSTSTDTGTKSSLSGTTSSTSNYSSSGMENDTSSSSQSSSYSASYSDGGLYVSTSSYSDGDAYNATFSDNGSASTSSGPGTTATSSSSDTLSFNSTDSETNQTSISTSSVYFLYTASPGGSGDDGPPPSPQTVTLTYVTNYNDNGTNTTTDSASGSKGSVSETETTSSTDSYSFSDVLTSQGAGNGYKSTVGSGTSNSATVSTYNPDGTAVFHFNGSSSSTVTYTNNYGSSTVTNSGSYSFVLTNIAVAPDGSLAGAGDVANPIDATGGGDGADADPPGDLLDQAANFVAGWGDTLSAGLTDRIRDSVSIGGVGLNDGIHKNSGQYQAGQAVGLVHTLAIGFANPCGLAAGLNVALRALNGAQVVGGLLNGFENIGKGNYGSAAFDFLGVAFSAKDVFGACFGAGTPILTPEGSKAIEDFRPGDLVISREEGNPEGVACIKVVEEIFVKQAEIWELQVDGRAISTTAEHPFWVKGRGWTAAARLMEGDRLATLNGSWVVVDRVSSSGTLMAVHNIRVAEYHTYFVGDDTWEFAIWAHNANNCWNYFQQITKTIFKNSSEAARAFKNLAEQLSLPADVQRALLRYALRYIRQIGEVAHHLIPLEAFKKFPALLRKAAEGGFDINGINNGIALIKDVEHFGGHPIYNSVVLKALGEIPDNLTPSQAAAAVQRIADILREAIRNGTFLPIF